MSWRVVAAKDFRDATRSLALWALAALFLLALSGLAIAFVLVNRRASFPGLLTFLSTLVVWLVPVTALVVSYKAVVGERESGTLAVLLSLPLSHRDVVLGKAIGRATAVTVPVVVGFAVMALVASVLYSRFLAGLFLLVVGLSVLLGLVFTSVGVAVSALTRSTVRAASGALGAFVLSTFLWDLVPAGIYFLLNGRLPGSRRLPDWFFLVEHLNPSNAFTYLVTTFAPTMLSPVPRPAPFYLRPWFTVVLLLLWVLVPVGVGYLRFRTVELT